MLEELIRPSRFYDCPKLIRITLTYIHPYVSMRSIRSYRRDVMIRGSENLRKMIALILPRHAAASRINHAFFAREVGSSWQIAR